jgi:hypothetical protein
VPYEHGPPCWSNSTQAGAYAWTALVQPGKSDKECPAPEASGAWLPPHGLRPVSLRAHGEPLSSCFLACNLTEVALSGVDPCNAASLAGNSSEASLKGVFANYSCYYGGPSWLHPAGLGVCGFNCSAHQVDTGALCSAEDIEADKCLVYCDSRALPMPAAGAARGSPGRGSLPTAGSRGSGGASGSRYTHVSEQQ